MKCKCNPQNKKRWSVMHRNGYYSNFKHVMTVGVHTYTCSGCGQCWQQKEIKKEKKRKLTSAEKAINAAKRYAFAKRYRQ